MTDRRVRYMRMIVFFDLPILTEADKKEYRHFRRFLINEGFVFMQQSVYVRLVINDAAYMYELDRLTQHKPPKGLVQVLRITEKQFSNMTYLTGEAPFNDRETSLKGLIII